MIEGTLDSFSRGDELLHSGSLRDAERGGVIEYHLHEEISEGQYALTDLLLTTSNLGDPFRRDLKLHDPFIQPVERYSFEKVLMNEPFIPFFASNYVPVRILNSFHVPYRLNIQIIALSPGRAVLESVALACNLNHLGGLEEAIQNRRG